MRASFPSAVPCKGLIVLALLGGTGLAQVPTALSDGESAAVTVASARTGPGAVTASPVRNSALLNAPDNHRFWDNENRALFATVAALCAADFVITRANL